MFINPPQADPFFVHSFDVTEEEFHALKADQNILVDFATFPRMFVELVESVIGCRGAGEAARFVAVLACGAQVGADSAFSVVETNHFKQVGHISLAFRAGDDAAIKAYLAGRLYEHKARGEALAEKLGACEEELEAQGDALGEARREVVALRSTADARAAGAAAEHQAELVKAREAALEDLAETRGRLEREKAEAARGWAEAEAALEAKAEQLATKNKELTDAKYGLEARLSETTAKAEALARELDAERGEVARLRAANRTAEGDTHETTKDLTAARIRLSAVEQQATDKGEMLARAERQLADLEGHRSSLEESLRDARQNVERSEERVAVSAAEIRKGNSIIERLQGDMRAAKAKLKMRAQAQATAESGLSERQSALDATSLDAQRARNDADAARREAEVSAGRAEELKAKLEEAQALLQSNQQMIQWLNSQVNEAQLGRGAATRYTFRSATAVSGGEAAAGANSPADTEALLAKYGVPPASKTPTVGSGPIKYEPKAPGVTA